MEVTRTITDIRRLVRRAKKAGQKVGFVPTLGALHDGHLSLIAQARQESNFLVVSIFLNPTQFGPGEDLNKYPHQEQQDLELCEKAAVDAVFLPSVQQMYPVGYCTSVKVQGLSDKLCGAHRPGHFEAVSTVVAKLFNIVGPDLAYFGQKDAQQALIITRMVQDLNMPIQIRLCPTVREKNGLAMSSRNAYLTLQQRSQAACLYRALLKGKDLIEVGQRDPQVVTEVMKKIIAQAGPCQTDYIVAVDPQTLEPVKKDSPVWLLAVVVWIGQARLIDNIVVDISKAK